MRQGLTLIELILVMAILMTVASLGLWAGLDFYGIYNLNSEENNLVTVLRRARNLSLGNYNGAAHGVYIGTNNYTLYQGASYASRNQSFDQIFSPNNVNFSGLTEINFSQLGAASSASGTITIASQNKNRIITINNEGAIDF